MSIPRQRSMSAKERDEFIRLVLRVAKLDPELVPDCNGNYDDPYAAFAIDGSLLGRVPVRATIWAQPEHWLSQVQGAVQLAIERRGWAWFVQATPISDTDRTLVYVADIDCLDGGGSQRTGSHPALALLKAYVDVLDVHDDQDDEEAA